MLDILVSKKTMLEQYGGVTKLNKQKLNKLQANRKPKIKCIKGDQANSINMLLTDSRDSLICSRARAISLTREL